MKGKVLLKGVVRVVASGSVSQLTLVAPDDNGKVKSGGSGDAVVGLALESAGSTGGEITIILR